MMRIQFLRRYRAFKPERIAVIPDGAANVLIRRGIAKECIEEAEVGAVIETASVVPPETTAANSPRRRGRPRKYPQMRGNSGI